MFKTWLQHVSHHRCCVADSGVQRKSGKFSLPSCRRLSWGVQRKSGKFFLDSLTLTKLFSGSTKKAVQCSAVQCSAVQCSAVLCFSLTTCDTVFFCLLLNEDRRCYMEELLRNMKQLAVSHAVSSSGRRQSSSTTLQQKFLRLAKSVDTDPQTLLITEKHRHSRHSERTRSTQ